MSEKNKLKKSNSSSKWLEVSPYGIVDGMIPKASTMVFKRKNGKESFSIWLSELQSQVAINQSINKENTFGFIQTTLKKLNIKLKYCFFTNSKHGRDIVALTFEGNLKPVYFYADEVISFCILNRCRFFCKESFFIRKSNNRLPKRFQENVELYKKPVYLN